jgi:hypothetical protein
LLNTIDYAYVNKDAIVGNVANALVGLRSDAALCDALAYGICAGEGAR